MFRSIRRRWPQRQSPPLGIAFGPGPATSREDVQPAETGKALIAVQPRAVEPGVRRRVIGRLQSFSTSQDRRRPHKRIAQELEIELRTVEKHLRKAYAAILDLEGGAGMRRLGPRGVLDSWA